MNSFIYGRADDRGPARWREDLAEMRGKVVDAYRKEPLVESLDYLFALDTVSQPDDRTFILWREITDIAPMKEMKKRAGYCKQMQVELLQGLIFNEFKRVHRASLKRKLARELKTLNDDLINDIIPVKIDSGMPVLTLHVLETIFYLRLQLAQVGWEDNEPIYNSYAATDLSNWPRL